MLRAGADITFVPLDATRSVVFELNGSLKVESIERDGKALTGFVQDAVGVGLAWTQRAHRLGQVVPANQPVTLRPLEWRTRFARRWAAGYAAFGVRGQRRFVPDVCLALVSVP